MEFIIKCALFVALCNARMQTNGNDSTIELVDTTSTAFSLLSIFNIHFGVNTQNYGEK